MVTDPLPYITNGMVPTTQSENTINQETSNASKENTNTENITN